VNTDFRVGRGEKKGTTDSADKHGFLGWAKKNHESHEFHEFESMRGDCTPSTFVRFVRFVVFNF
jgi:hypothetical protein